MKTKYQTFSPLSVYDRLNICEHFYNILKDNEDLNELVNKHTGIFDCAMFNITTTHHWFRKNLFMSFSYEIRLNIYHKHEVGVSIIKALQKKLYQKYGIKVLHSYYDVIYLTKNQMNNLFTLLKLKGEI